MDLYLYVCTICITFKSKNYHRDSKQKLIPLYSKLNTSFSAT